MNEFEISVHCEQTHTLRGRQTAVCATTIYLLFNGFLSFHFSSLCGCGCGVVFISFKREWIGFQAWILVTAIPLIMFTISLGYTFWAHAEPMLIAESFKCVYAKWCAIKRILAIFMAIFFYWFLIWFHVNDIVNLQVIPFANCIIL